MTRLPPLTIDELPDDQLAAVQRAEELMGFVSNDTLTMARNPALMDAFAGLVGAVYAPGAISSGMKRLLGLMTSSAAGCTYCVGHTAFASERQGIDRDKLQAIWEFESSELFSSAERAALRVALHAGQSPNGVTDKMFAELGNYFDEDAQLEIVSVIALFGFLNRWNSTLATDLESLPAATLQTVGHGAASG
ncbi:MAG: carboxymuconolactone decarboxylase family protein [Gammaproteobacteria bacterium]|nr:carboxymuconolactone decarboxylase family protein [Gammaproteobacteria bacterium]